MKVCILSMQKVQNFGSLLQAYALKNLLEQKGQCVDFIDIISKPEEDVLLESRKNVFPCEGEASGTLWAKIKKLDRYAFNRIKIKYLAKKQNNRFDQFRKEVLKVDSAANDRYYDCCVIGSDEVFNCLSGAEWGYTSQLFGNVPNAKRVITYAASCGATVFENVPQKVKQSISQAFQNIAAFSVRDKNTYEFVSQLTQKKVEEHLDPALIYDFSKEIEKADLPKSLPARYCLVYSYYNRIKEESDIKHIKQFCRKHGLEIVSAGAPQKWIKNHLVVDPFSLLKVFQNAEFIITDTFHGTIFSAKYAKKFAVVERESNSNKLLDLLNRLQLKKHLIPSLGYIENAESIKNDTERVKQIVATEKVKSDKYLTEHM